MWTVVDRFQLFPCNGLLNLLNIYGNCMILEVTIYIHVNCRILYVN